MNQNTRGDECHLPSLLVDLGPARSLLMEVGSTLREQETQRCCWDSLVLLSSSSSVLLLPPKSPSPSTIPISALFLSLALSDTSWPSLQLLNTPKQSLSVPYLHLRRTYFSHGSLW